MSSSFDYVPMPREEFEQHIGEEGWQRQPDTQQGYHVWSKDEWSAEVDEVASLAGGLWTRIDYKGSDPIGEVAYALGSISGDYDDEACHEVFGCDHFGGAKDCPICNPEAEDEEVAR